MRIDIVGLGRSGTHAIQYWLSGHFSRVNMERRWYSFESPEPHNFYSEDVGDDTTVICVHEHLRIQHILQSVDSARPIILIRNPFNHFASWMELKRQRTNLDWNRLDHNQIEMWKEYAREFLGQTNLVPLKIVVKYDEWFRSEIYRKSISSELGLEFTDAKLNYMAIRSSFDEKAYQNRAQEMSVLKRWKIFQDSPDFRSMFDEEVRSMSEQIFGPSPF